MSKVNQLKNKARREEQRENWSRAIEFYTQALDASRAEDESFADLSLYNRIGDIYLRIGQKNTAVRYYEQAIERYSEQDLHTSAIALCNKVLRVLPERSTVYLQLGRLHLETNLIADARVHFHQYAAAMRDRGGAAAAYDALEELITRTGDRPTLTLWVAWLAEEPEPGVSTTRVEEIREALAEQGIEADEVLEKIRTGDASGFAAEQSEVAREDPLATAFLSVPDYYGAGPPGVGAGATPVAEPHAAGGLAAEPASDDGADPDEEPRATDSERAEAAVLEGMHTVAADLDLTVIGWNDDLEPYVPDVPAAVDESGAGTDERPERDAIAGPADVDLDDGFADRAEVPEPADAEIDSGDVPVRAPLEDLESSEVPRGAHVAALVDEVAFEVPEGVGDYRSTLDGKPELDPLEPELEQRISSGGVAASIEGMEGCDESEAVAGLASAALAMDAVESSSPLEHLGSDFASPAAFELEPPTADVATPDPDGAEPPEPHLYGAPLGTSLSPRDEAEIGAGGRAAAAWHPMIDVPEAADCPSTRGEAIALPTIGLDLAEPSIPEGEEWVASAHEEVERVTAEGEAARLAAERAEAERLAAEQAAEERAEAERLAAEQAAVERAEAERLAAERAAAEAERVAAEQAAAEQAAAEEAAAEEAAMEHAPAVDSEATPEATALDVDDASLEAETIAVEQPRASDAPTDDGATSTSAPAPEEIARPSAEPRSRTIAEDPDDAFGDWVASASQGVLLRALPELEGRDEHEKALLVIGRLSDLEDHDVEFRRRFVDALQDLGRIEQATEACLALAAGLEALGRMTEARQVYARVMDLSPGDRRGEEGFERLEGVRDPAEPDDTNMIATQPRHENTTPGNGSPGPRPDEHPRPYSGVAGGAEAASDFEQLLSEFRAELSEKPTTSDSMSRTEYGASLKEMGRLDDAMTDITRAIE
ncbi:MAG: tetratricopeptide repeat protein, partial [Gemmatimonadetes bacterium]|nr:tetratricopeptide repeat protein [Gemmatimonadota bacterium]